MVNHVAVSPPSRSKSPLKHHCNELSMAHGQHQRSSAGQHYQKAGRDCDGDRHSRIGSRSIQRQYACAGNLANTEMLDLCGCAIDTVCLEHLKDHFPFGLAAPCNPLAFSTKRTTEAIQSPGRLPIQFESKANATK
jgi:hypothetical protein